MSTDRPGKLELLLLASATALLLLIGYALWDRASERSELRTIFADAGGTPSERMRAAVKKIEADVDLALPDEYFLLPVFSRLRPTALQVYHGGGDCAYRARLLIVALDEFDVEASKIAVYTAEDEPIHAIAQVDTERGRYIVDMYFNVVHEDERGDPIPLSDLADPATLRASVQRAVDGGNELARKYPFEKYALGNTRTINWDESWPFRAVYWLGSRVVGEETMRSLPRPRAAEEPQVMVAYAAGGMLATCLLFAFWLRRRRLRRVERRSGPDLEEDQGG
ncbi:MAG: hypothetical protein AAGD14_04440 [Planctomycetota bacterium]